MMKLELQIAEGEHFYGGAVNDGVFMPYKNFSRDLRVWHAGNQATSALISDYGRVVYSHKPFRFTVSDGVLTAEGDGIERLQCGNTLKSAYLGMRKAFGGERYAGRYPEKELFLKPQYNTWIEMEWDCSQEKVLRYAKEILENGYPAGVLMIDDCWCRAYGDWEFDASRFPSPREMVDTLHGMGFKVMLWCCPFVSPDTAVFRELESMGALVRTQTGETAISHWWNGYSAALDLTDAKAKEWFFSRTDRLMKKYGIDGFKMDAGDPEYYPDGFVFSDGSERSFQAKIWSEMGERFSLSELRAGFNAGWLPVANRLRDKNHSWTDDGLNTLVPDGIAMGLCGYQYLCPDMIGGGMVPDFHREGFVFDGELFVRYCQVAALFPMMQFSRAPWKVLSREEQEACLLAVGLHEKFSAYLMECVERCSRTGEPVLRSLEYQFPHEGYAEIKDEFLLGESLLVAPQLVRNATERTVILPEGTWKDLHGTVFPKGVYTVSTPLNEIPVFQRTK